MRLTILYTLHSTTLESKQYVGNSADDTSYNTHNTIRHAKSCIGIYYFMQNRAYVVDAFPTSNNVIQSFLC